MGSHAPRRGHRRPLHRYRSTRHPRNPRTIRSMEPAVDIRPERPSVWGWVGWVAILIIIAIVLVGIARGTRSELAGASLASAITTGDRPSAPALPRARLGGVRTERLPGWYRPRRAGGGLGASNLWNGPMVVNFWASWCGPCRDEAPALNRLQKSFAKDGLVVVGVNAGAEDTRSDARDFVREFSVGYPVVVATAADQRAWGVDYFPETFIVGRDGRISAKIDGPIDEASLTAAVEKELARFKDQ